jgi:hypothetical protein
MAAKKRNPNGSGNISQRDDGRYELKVFVDTPDGRRKRISVYGLSWEEVDAERTRLKYLQRKGITVYSTTSTVEQYMLYWLTGTLRYLLRLVRAALQDAVEEELLARNVARQVKMPSGSIRKVTPWSADEAWQVSQDCTTRPALCAVGGRIGNRPEAWGGARPSVGRCGPGQWTGRHYEGALACGDEPGLAGRENRIVCRLRAVAGRAYCDLAAPSA